MAAEPAPPGPPDDRVSALEDRVAALEDYRDHEAPHSARAAGMGLEVVQAEVRDVSVKLTRVIQRQDQAEATLRDVVSVQQEQGRVLDRIGRVLERHGRTLEAQGETLASHGEMLGSHGEMLGSHGEMLAEILRRLPAGPE
jgi:hypothetical protein